VPSPPPGWPDAAAEGFYYVDNSVAESTNAQNPFGSRQHPRRTIPEGELAAGSYVELHGGPYTSDRHIVFARGSATQPVWIRGADRRDPTLIRTQLLVSGQHVVIENLTFDSSRKTLGLVESKAVCVRYNVFAGPGRAVGNSAAIFVVARTSEAKSSGNVIYKNTIRDFGDATSIKENDYHGILVSRHSEHTWILENEIYNNGGDAVQVGGASLPRDASPQFVYIARNRMYGNRENAVDIKRARDVIVAANDIRDYRPTSSSEGAGVVIHNDPDNIWILHNVIANADIGIISTGSTNTWFVGNVIYDIRSSLPAGNTDAGYRRGVAMHLRGKSNGGVIGNTIAYYDVGLQLVRGNQSGYLVQNNIFAFRLRAEADDIYVASGEFSQALTISHNLHYSGTNEFKSTWAGRSFHSPADLQRGTGKFDVSLTENPAFVDAEGRDFRLRADSPSIGRGVRTDIGEKFRARYGIGFGCDKNELGQGTEPGPVIGACPGVPPG
jgi:nitrous oxidase accessory protein NosD